jgi:hypothetical protein
MPPPDVSVIIPVYNTAPYLDRCLRSVLNQTIGRSAIEVIAVDDGSTDGGDALLDRYARKHPAVVDVIHQANSGGPAAPLNRGLERATGRYVFFLGSDDYLGREAVARLTATAERHDSDVVLGRVVGDNGRYIDQAVYAQSSPEVGLHDSSLPWSLSNTKLFRRDPIERHGLRFREDLRVFSDQPFTLEMYFRARRISVLADYGYYYATQRADRTNITCRARPDQILRSVASIMDLTEAFAAPGPIRDAFHTRHFSWELAGLVGVGFLDLDPCVQDQICAGIGRLAKRHLNDAILDGLDVSKRVRLSLAGRGALDALRATIREDGEAVGPPVIVEHGRAFAGYSCFRQPGPDLPDEIFDITGKAVERLARRFRVTSMGWSGRARDKALVVTSSWPPTAFAALGPVAASVTAAQVPGEIAWTDSASGPGPYAVARFPVAPLVAAIKPRQAPHVIRIRVEAFGATSEVPVRAPEAPGRTLTYRLGARLFRLHLSRNRWGHLVVDIAPVTIRRVLGIIRRSLTPGRTGP